MMLQLTQSSHSGLPYPSHILDNAVNLSGFSKNVNGWLNPGHKFGLQQVVAHPSMSPSALCDTCLNCNTD